jgi:hypothetical protein
VPRKFRPPASKRRRTKKTVEYDFPPGEQATSEAAVADEAGYAAETEEAAPVATASVRSDGRGERHTTRDYTHVRNEVLRIAIIGAILIVVIVVGGFFR